jgi:MFS family permease
MAGTHSWPALEGARAFVYSHRMSSQAMTFDSKATLVVALATVGICDVAFGLTLQLQPLLMEARGIPAWIIGLNATMGAIGILSIGPFLPAIVEKLGSRQVARIAIITIVATLLLMPAVPLPYWWFPLRFFMGMAIGSLFAVSETWVLSIATEENRGRLMGIYTSTLSVTFAAGPMMLPWTGIEGWTPWLICAACVTLGLFPLSTLNVREVAEEGGKGGLLDVIGRAPMLFGCIAAATVFDSILISFFTIFAERNGVEIARASWLLGVGIIAGVALFYPIGLLADRWSKPGTIVITALLTIAAALALRPLLATFWAWPLAIIFITAAFGIYVVALAVIGDLFKGKDMVAASAAVAAMWGVGGIIGPPIAGRLIDHYGVNAFPWVLSGIYALVVLALTLNRFRISRLA